MSPGNSYFKENVIRWLIDQARQRFEWFRIMIPDYPAQYTYRAKWESRPESKARLKWNAIRNKVSSILWPDEQRRLTIDWKEHINTSVTYRRSIRNILVLFRNNEAFRDAVRWTTKEVLLWWRMWEVAEEKVKIGVKFLLCELAFLESAKEILWSEVTYVYHRSWPIFSDFIAWKFDGKKREIDFEVIEVETET
jgi:tRNA-dependent cyclodipeptide synthase